MTDTEIRTKGFHTLVDAMGPVEAERFVALILREPFDYTQWRSQLWADRSVEDISRSAMEFRRGTGPVAERSDERISRKGFERNH